jgi:toxin FitB
MYLLDTNIISESRKLGSTRINPHAAIWFEHIDISQTFLSAMTLFELERGVRHIERRDGVQGLTLRRWLNEQVMVSFEDHILPLSSKVAVICAGLHIPDPKAERDAWIAATAIDAGLTLATRNIGDFSNMGLAIVNPFEAEPTI